MKSYDGEEYFLLRHDGKEYEIDEPIGFDAIENIFGQDSGLNFGYNTDYVNSDTQLTFSIKEGGSVLESIYDTLGTDEIIEFEFGTLVGTTKTMVFKSRINLNSRVYNEKGFTCSIDNQAFNSLLRTRIDTVVKVNDAKTIDGKTDGTNLTAITEKKLRLHSKQIIKSSEYGYDPQYSQLYADISDAAQWTQTFLQPDTNAIVSEELDETLNLPLGLRNVDPFTVAAFQYEVAEAGLLRAVFTFTGTFSVENSPSGNSAVYFLKIERAAAIVKNLEINAVLGTNIPIDPTTGTSKPLWVSGQTYNAGDIVMYGNQHYRCKFNGFSSSTPPPSDTTNWEDTAYYSQFTIDHKTTGSVPDEFRTYVQAGDRVFIGVKITHTQVNTTAFTLTPQVKVNDFTNTLLYEQATVAPATRCPAYNLFDVLTQAVESVTNQTDAVISPILDVGGEMEKLALFNGYAIRQFDVANRPLELTVGQIIEAVQALRTLGIGYRTVGGVEKMVVLPMMDFNGTGLILEIKELWSYEEHNIKELYYNEVETGYQNYADEDKNTIDEFNTQQLYLTPIKTYKAKLSRICPFVGSGFSIEKQRREQFKDEPSTSMPDDDKVFITPYSENYDNFYNVDKVVYENVSFQAYNASSKIFFSKDLGLHVGDWLILLNTVSNNGTLFTVTDVIGASNGIEYVVNFAPTNETGTCTANAVYDPVTNGIIAERNEPFEVIDSILSPSSVYGLRISPKRMLYNAAPLLNICTWFKADTDKLINSFTKNNKTARSKFYSTSDNKGLAGDATITEGEDIALSDYYGRNRAYLPKGVTFKTVLTHEEILLIRQALRGELGDSRDYGRFLVTTDNGEQWLMKLLEMRYKPKTGEAAMTMAKIEKYS